uniref:Uncharacterized protein n=2 Tax=Magallana gigas TaxID=29159 RepID=A0A8W8J5T1_MAGGI|nr:DNA ligase 1 isoform X2 [Crassostrea gigas]
MSDTESSARTSDDSDQEVEEEEVEEEEDVDEEESEEGEEEEVEEEEVEDEEDIEDEDDDIDTNDENDENDESDDSDHNTIKSDTESDSEKISTESESDDDSGGDEKKIGKKTVKTKMKTQPVEDKLMKKEILALKHKSDSDEDSNTDDNSESDKQQSVKKEKGLVGKVENKESIKETEIKVQPVDSVRKESPKLQQKSDSDDKQGSEGELKGLAHKIETEDSQKETKIHPQHVEDKSVKIDSPEFKRKHHTEDDFKSNSKREEPKGNGTVKDLAAKPGNKESKHVESVKEESLALQQKSHLAKDSNGNDNSKSDQQESRRKVIGHAVKMENKESEKETEIKVQPVKSVRKESPELQQKSHSAKGSKGNDTFKSDKQEMKDIAAKTESNKTKIIAAQPVEDKSMKKELSELRRISNSSDNYKSNKQGMEVKVPAAKTEINESKKESKINTQPVEAESVRKQFSNQANKALPTEKKEAKKEDFSQTTGVPGKYVQVDRCDVISTRRVGTQTKLKHYNVCTFTSGLIKKVNMQTYTSGLISKSDHSTNTIQERGKDKKTQTKDKYVLERHLIVKDNDSSEKKTTDNKDTTKKSDENENETSVQLKRRKVKVPLLKLSPEEESNSANSTESTEDRPPQPDLLSKKAKDIKSIQKLQKTPIESSGVYTDKEYDKKTRKEKENIRRRGRRRPQLCNFSKRHPSREYIPQPSKNKTSHFRRPTSAGPVYKRELINPIHRPGDSKNKILLVRPNSAGPVHKRQSKQPEGTALSMAQYRMLYHHRWADISC